MFSIQPLRKSLVSAAFQRRALSTGQALPNVALRHNSPGNSFSIPTAGKQIVVGVPAAFSPGCSNSHVPGYLSTVAAFKKHGVEGIYVVSVNDAFVMNAWSASFASDSTKDVLEADGQGETYIKFLADHDGAWTKAAELDFDASSILGSARCKRFAAIVDGGKVKKLFVEPDGTGITVSTAENVLNEL